MTDLRCFNPGSTISISIIWLENLIGRDTLSTFRSEFSPQGSPLSTSQRLISFEGLAMSTLRCQLRRAASNALEKKESPGLLGSKCYFIPASVKSTSTSKSDSLMGSVSGWPSEKTNTFLEGPKLLTAVTDWSSLFCCSVLDLAWLNY